MRRLVGILALAAASCAAQPGWAAQGCADMKADGVAAFFDQWNLALATLNADQVAQLYWPDATLLPMDSGALRTGRAAIREHFVKMLERRPRARVDSRRITVGCNMAVDAGRYTISLMRDGGEVSEIAARYTFVHQYRDGAWKVIHHHASMLPEQLAQRTESERPADASTATYRTADANEPESRPENSLFTNLFVNVLASPKVWDFHPHPGRHRRERGVVGVWVCVDAKGVLTAPPAVVRSSGSAQLDTAARRWAEAARWVPATSAGRPVPTCSQVDVPFD